MRKVNATRRAAVIRPTLGLVLMFTIAMFAPAEGTSDLCGATIVADLELDHDLACQGSGLIVGADGITLNLNGHTISGTGSGDGIAIVGRTNVTVAGGRIQNFEAGVRIAACSAVQIKGNQLAENTEGVDCAAGCTGNTIMENEFRDNRSRGIMLRGATSDNVVKENTFTGNRVGILLFGSVDSIVKENTLASSVVANIRVNVLATGNLIKENTAISSLAGIEFLATMTGSATGNSVVENTLIVNMCGLKGPLGGNTILENVFVGNATQICS